VKLTAEAADDRVFSAAPRTFAAFHWHGDTYELPPAAVHLAHSDLYEQQAFVFRNAYALQFHLEATPALVAEWSEVPASGESRAHLPGDDPIRDLLEQVTDAAPESVQLARELFGRWLVNVVGHPAVAEAR
jgi:GMP synthase (glutamine-hydrolysing)